MFLLIHQTCIILAYGYSLLYKHGTFVLYRFLSLLSLSSVSLHVCSRRYHFFLIMVMGFLNILFVTAIWISS
jgi:hypothetical protein